MKRGNRWIVLTLILILEIIIFIFDKQIIRFIISFRCDVLDYLLLSVAFAGNTFIIFFFLTSLFLYKEHKRRWIFPLWISSLFVLLTSYLLKIIIQRPRPFQEGVSVLQIAFHFMRNNFHTWNFSFPSFDAMLVFAALPILDKEFKVFKYFWLIFACLVAFARVYFGVHYLSDVIAGALIGYLIGYLMVKLEEKEGIGLRILKRFKMCG